MPTNFEATPTILLLRSIRIDPFSEQLTYKNHLNNSNNVLFGRNGKGNIDVFTKVYHKVEKAKWKVILFTKLVFY